MKNDILGETGMHKLEKEKFRFVGFGPAICGFPVQRITAVLAKQLLWPWEK